MSEPYLGQIMMFAGNFAPTGWMLCQGQLLPIAQYSALFAILGTSFGGDGVRTFGLPDLRSRVPVGTGQGPGLTNYVIGEQAGSESVALTVNQMPSHNHMVGVSNAAGTSTDPTNQLVGQINTGTSRQPTTTAMGYAPVPQTGTMAPGAVSMNGNNQPHANIQPVLGITYCIAYQGVFPSRN